jgi:hypothetical protein
MDACSYRRPWRVGDVCQGQGATVCRRAVRHLRCSECVCALLIRLAQPDIPCLLLRVNSHCVAFRHSRGASSRRPVANCPLVVGRASRQHRLEMRSLRRHHRACDQLVITSPSSDRPGSPLLQALSSQIPRPELLSLSFALGTHSAALQSWGMCPGTFAMLTNSSSTWLLFSPLSRFACAMNGPRA